VEVRTQTCRLVLAPPLDAEEILRSQSKDMMEQRSTCHFGCGSWCRVAWQPTRRLILRIAEQVRAQVINALVQPSK
jgi:hypothetical protein